MDVAPAPRILVYDGDCRMCTTFSKLADRRWLVGPAERRPADSFEGETAVRLAEAGVHNELAVIDTTTDQIRTGYDGILWLMRGGVFAWLVPLFARGPLAWLGRTDYKTVAYNRRIISPVKRGIACACDPDLHMGYRTLFIVLCVVWMALITGVFADTLLGGGWWLGMALPAAWSLVALPGLGFPTPRNVDHLAHLAFVGTAMTLPALLAVIVRAVVLIVEGAPWWPGALQDPASGSTAYVYVAWGAALPIALVGCLRRMPRTGLSVWMSVLAALILWVMPAALVLLYGMPAAG